MDLARPRGVVFADKFAGRLLTSGGDVADFLSAEDVYIKSIAEREPMEVFVSDAVVIPPRNRHPLAFSRKVFSRAVTKEARTWKAVDGEFSFGLDAEPIDPTRVGVLFQLPIGDGGEQSGRMRNVDQRGTLDQRPTGLAVSVPLTRVVRYLESDQVDDSWHVRGTPYFET